MNTSKLTHYTERAMANIRANRVLHIITTVTIAFSILIISAFALFFVNAGDMISSWEKNIRVIAYLDSTISPGEIKTLKQEISNTPGVEDIFFVSREEALQSLKKQFRGQTSLVEDLVTNPLPDSVEASLEPTFRNMEKIESLAIELRTLKRVESVEYGQGWIDGFIKLFNLFRYAGTGVSILFLMAVTFITAFTIRLSLYSRKKEIVVMRLVGATDSFIKGPFYIEGLIQGAVGSILGIMVLFIIFTGATSQIEQLSSNMINISFISFKLCFLIIFCSTLVGCLGCYLSLRQFLK